MVRRNVRAWCGHLVGGGCRRYSSSQRRSKRMGGTGLGGRARWGIDADLYRRLGVRDEVAGWVAGHEVRAYAMPEFFCFVGACIWNGVRWPARRGWCRRGYPAVRHGGVQGRLVVGVCSRRAADVELGRSVATVLE